jgi:hypothetical protein
VLAAFAVRFILFLGLPLVCQEIVNLKKILKKAISSENTVLPDNIWVQQTNFVVFTRQFR